MVVSPSGARGQQSSNPAAVSTPQPAAPQQKPAQAASASDKEEEAALEDAVDSAHRDPQVFIKNLEKFLEKFPHSARREQILRSIYQAALQSNDPRDATAYGEKLLDIHPSDPALLSSLVDLLDRENDAASRATAITYAARFIDVAEKDSRAPTPNHMSAAQWQETTSLVRANGYLMRGKLYAKADENDKAFNDYEMSFAAYPSSQVAERLGDLAAKKGDGDRALNYYATAFAFPARTVDPVHREELRNKLGFVYKAKYKSENGLGDLILARYDELNRTLEKEAGTSSTGNDELRDPFQFVMHRLDGSPIRMADYRGKVMWWISGPPGAAPAGWRAEFWSVFRTTSGAKPASFLAVNVDQDRSGVEGFVREEKWKVSVAYADGLDRLLEVGSLPTIVIFDRQGRVVYR